MNQELSASIKWLALSIVAAAFVVEFGPCEGGTCVNPYAKIGHVATTSILLMAVLLALPVGVYLFIGKHIAVRRRAAVHPAGATTATTVADTNVAEADDP